MRRLGKTSANGKPRPLLVQFFTNIEVMTALRNKKKFPTLFSITSDKTKLQREYLSSLISEVDAYNT